MLFPDTVAPPVMNAAGTIKTVADAVGLVGVPVPAVVVGSYTLQERSGNGGRTFYETSSGALNSMGLPGPGIDVWSKWVREMAGPLQDDGKELWVSVAGFAPEEYRILAEAAFDAGADAVEANLGCPNIWADGEQKPIASYDPHLCAAVMHELSGLMADRKIGVKLSPILDAVLLAEVDAVLVDAGVAFVSAVNTVPNCFSFAEGGVPAITYGLGLAGMSGPAVKWLGLGQVISHRDRLADTPIIGVGGISSGQDFADYLRSPVRADACQVGTAYWRRGRRALIEILQEWAELEGMDQQSSAGAPVPDAEGS